MRPTLAVALALLAALAGCAAPTAAPAGTTAPSQSAAPGDGGGRAGPGSAPAPDPDEDVLGWENGYWYDDPVDANGSDGLTEAEREAVVARTMARVEHIRRKEFRSSVPVEVVSRETYREQSRRGSPPPDVAAFQDAVWEAMLLVGEGNSSAEVFDVLYGASVQGYYTPADDGKIVLVSDTPGTPAVETGVLAHELVHAIQDQHLGGRVAGRSLDAQLAKRGVTEGDANYVQHVYERRCGTNWSCVDSPNRTRSARPDGFNTGLFLTLFVPYTEGPPMVRALRRAGGWTAVDGAHADPPHSTEQVIHPERYPDEEPVDVAVPDRSDGEWDRFTDLPRNRPERQTAGEATLFAMLWANGAVNRSALSGRGTDLGPYNYSAPATDGWGGDTVVPYRNEDGELGYVLATVWDTRADAREFERAYREALANHSARERGGDVLVVPDGPFADAFRVTRDGRRVVVVNGPEVGALERIHPRASG